MATINTYTLRKAILSEMRRAIGAPLTAVELANIAAHPAIRHADLDTFLAEFDNLKNLNYIAAIAGFGGQYCKITERGLQQLSIEYPQDSYIHGPGALQ